MTMIRSQSTEAFQTYYFEEGTDKWKYRKTDETLMEIIEYGNNVDENLFRIPKGYSKMEM